MAIVGGKRSVMILYSKPHDLHSHRVRIVLAEKGVTVETIQVTGDTKPKELLEFNPFGKVPTLIDRDLVLYDSRIIMEYLDERFPHPPLLPVYPVARAKSRLLMYQIEKDWYPEVQKITEGTEPEAKVARKRLLEGLLKVIPACTNTPYFLSEEFSLVDCCLMPLLWQLPKLGITLPPQAKALKTYAELLFKRTSFKVSLLEVEQVQVPA